MGRGDGGPEAGGAGHAGTGGRLAAGGNATDDGATVKLYVNGQLEKSEPYAGKLRSDKAPVHLGGGKLFGVDWGNQFTVHGTVDEVMIFGRSLTAREVRQICDIRE
ncbi:MAG: hypothetical protein NTV49_07865 [Kiritimatiellaeota bacterium]|nr:hypothetical protein [Kiritimatiellota bacterium]